MRNNQKGFTLIELLVTIALMLSILGIAIVSFINISNRKKEETWTQVKDQIETAATEYFTANEYLFEGLSDRTSGSITVGRLVEEDYLGKVIDPRSGTSLDYCSEVSVTKENGKYVATYTGNPVAKVDGKCENENLVQVKDVGGPSGEVNYYKEDDTRLANDGWFNITKLGENGKLKVCINPSTNGNGAIVNAKVGNKVANKESNGYYCTIIEEDIDKNVAMELENTSGKKWYAEPKISKDTINPSCAYSVSGGTIGNKVGNIQWYKKGAQPKVTYTGSDTAGNINSGIDGIYQYTDDKLYRKSNSNTYTEDIRTNWNGYYNAVVKDKAGNHSRCGSYYGYDNTSPSCSIKTKNTNKMSNGWFNGPAYFMTNSISDDVNTWTWKTDEWDEAPTYEFSQTKPNDIDKFYVTAAGNRTVTINMTDIAGNTGTCSKTVKLYSECSETELSGSCDNSGYRARVDKYTGGSCGAKEDCSISDIAVMLDERDVKDGGMSGAGPIGTNSGKGIFACSGTYDYDNRYKRGINSIILNVGENYTHAQKWNVAWDNNWMTYAGSACMYVGDFERRLVYKIKWSDDTVSDYIYTKVKEGFDTSDYTSKLFTRRADGGIQIKINEDNSYLQLRDCRESDLAAGYKAEDCGRWDNDSPNLTKHVYYLSYGDINSNKLAIYTKYFRSY